MAIRKQKILASLLSAFMVAASFVGGAVLNANAAVTTPTTINYQGRLLSAANVPLAGNYTFRFSAWNTADWVVGDTTVGGAINVGSVGYAGWQEAQAVTTDTYGLFNINLGSITPFPSFDANTHKNLQVEVKVTGALDTTYEILDPAGTLADTNDRKPLQNQAFAQNADTLDNIDAPSVLRSDTSDNFTSGTLTFDNGTTLTANGIVNIGDGGDAVAVNSNTWDINTAGVASGLTGLASTGVVDFSGATRLAMQSGAGNPATCTEGDLFYNTTTNLTYACTATNTWSSLGGGGGGAMDFEGVYSTDADKTLTTSNGAFTIAAGSGAVNINSTNANGVSLNNNINGNVNIGTGTSTGTVSVGGGSGTVQISSADWGISSTGDMTNIGAINMDGLLTGTAGATLSGAAISLNNSSNFTVKIGTGTSTGAVSIGGTGTQTINVGNGAGNKTVNLGSSTTSSTTTILSGSGMTWINDSNDQDTNINTGTSAGTVNIGGGSGPVAINSSTWDITSAGAASGFTGITSTGKINFSGSNGFRIREIATITNPGTPCTNVGELIMETSTSTLYACLDAGTDTWQAVGGAGNANTLDGLDSTQFLRSDTSDNYTSGTLTFDNGTTLTVNGVANIGDGGDNVAVNSGTWDISAAGVASGFTGMTSTGTINFSGSGGFRLREVANPNANAACAAINELIMNTTTSQLMRCTGVGGAGVATWTNVDTTGGSVDFEGLYANDADKTLTTSNGNFTVNTGTGDFIVTSNDWSVDAAGNATFGGTVNGVNLSSIPFGNLATRVKEAAFAPDYAGGSSKPDGTNNKGTLKLDFEDLGGTAKRAYYEWTTNQATLQDMDIVLSFQLPLDFVSFTATPVNLLYKTSNAVVGTNVVDVSIYDTTGTAVAIVGGTGLANAAWTNAAITFGGAPTFTAGDTITIRAKLSSTIAGFARISDLVLNYNGR